MRIVSSLASLTLSTVAVAQASWSMVYPPSTPPTRSFATFGAHETSGACLLMFGYDAVSGAPRTDAWRFQGNVWSSVPGAQPPWRVDPSIAFDTARGELVLFGGTNPGTSVFDDTWRWNGTQWTLANPVTRPPARGQAAMAFDRHRQRVVLFGGRGVGNPGPGLGDTWEWNGTNWQSVAVSGPSARVDAMMAFDPVSRSVLLHGGTTAFGAYVPFTDTWSHDGTAWIQRQPTTPPPFRAAARMVTDLHRQRVLLFGGNYADGFAWEWNGTQWSVAYQATPGARYGFGMVYDDALRRVVVHGGTVPAYGSAYFLNDTWIYRTALPADVAPFGAGCAGTAGIPTLAASPFTLPWLGDAMRTVVQTIPAGEPGAVFVSSFGSTPPVPLAGVGMPGCDLLVPIDVAEFRLAVAGSAEWTAAIPNVPALAAAVIRQQAFVFDAGANALGLAASNAITATLGVR